MNYILDTYAWIEYLCGTTKGNIVKEILDNKENRIMTLDCSIVELKTWSIRANENFDQISKTVSLNSHLIPVYLEDWLLAASLRAEKRKIHPDFGLIDSLLLAKRIVIGGKIVSGDKHFKEEKEVIFLKD